MIQISKEEWFQRINLFNQRSSESVVDDLSYEFQNILTKCGIQTTTINYPIGVSDNLLMYQWCNDDQTYQQDPTKPVLYIDTHYDVVWKDMITPLRLGDDLVIASCHDNRASCNIVCQAIENKIFAKRHDLIIYILFRW